MSSLGGRSVLSCSMTFPFSSKSQSSCSLVSGRSSGSSYLDCTWGLHIRLGTVTGVDPSGCFPSLAMVSSASVAKDAAIARATGSSDVCVCGAWVVLDVLVFRFIASCASSDCGSHSTMCSFRVPIPPAAIYACRFERSLGPALSQSSYPVCVMRVLGVLFACAAMLSRSDRRGSLYSRW